MTTHAEVQEWQIVDEMSLADGFEEFEFAWFAVEEPAEDMLATLDRPREHRWNAWLAQSLRALQRQLLAAAPRAANQ